MKPVIQYQEQIRFICQNCRGKFWIDKGDFREGIRQCPLCGLSEFDLVEEKAGDDNEDRNISANETERDSLAPDTSGACAFPILLNYEKIFLIITGIILFSLFIIAQYKLAAGHALILDTTFATVVTLLGVFLTEAIIEQIKIRFGETLGERIKLNHLVKSLKLNAYPESKIEFFLAMTYMIILFSVLVKLWTFPLENSNLYGIAQKILPSVPLISELDISYKVNIAILFAFIGIFILFGALLFLYFLIEPYLSGTLKFYLSWPFLYLINTLRVFHEIFRSIVKIILFITIAWPEFLYGCFYLLIRTLTDLEKKHNFLNIVELEYLIYVRSVLIIVGPLGYILIFAIRY